MMNMREERTRELADSALEVLQDALAATVRRHTDTVAAAVSMIVACLESGGKILICGNGGSAADSQHIAAEFVNRFRMDRVPLAALALTTDSSILTSCGNDFGFEQVFEKQVAALGRPGDILWAISTSGSSTNVIRAMEMARKGGMTCIGFTGSHGQEMARLSHILLNVASEDTPRIQEVHIFLAHIICDLVEQAMFGTAMGSL